MIVLFFTVPHWEENHRSMERGLCKNNLERMNKVLRDFSSSESDFEKLGLGLARDVSTELLEYVLGSYTHL